MAILTSHAAVLRAKDHSGLQQTLFRQTVGDTLYVTNDMGEVMVFRASDTFELIATIDHEQPIESSPIFANETVYIVTRQKVFAVGT